MALAVYALVFALDERWTGAGWLFGAAVAMQPLVLLVLPVLIGMAGRQHVRELLVVRSILPAAAVMVTPLVANFHVTAQALLQQPNFPNIDHVTPWTSLAPVVAGSGKGLEVAGGAGPRRGPGAGVRARVGGESLAPPPRSCCMGGMCGLDAALSHRIGDGPVLHLATYRHRLGRGGPLELLALRRGRRGGRGVHGR